MVENFDEANFDSWVMAYTSGRASIKNLEEYADSLKNTEKEKKAADLFFSFLDMTNFYYNGPLEVRERSSKAMSIIRERFYQA